MRRAMAGEDFWCYRNEWENNGDSLVGEDASASGAEAHVAGNIGVPLSELVNSSANHKDAIAVCEISSFQAEITQGLSLDGLIWTNFAEDHMDRYDTMDEYFYSKCALFSCLKKSAPVCVSEDLLEFKDINFWKSCGAKIVKVDKVSKHLKRHRYFSPIRICLIII